MKQSIPIAAHTPVTPRPNTWVAIQTIPMRKPHMPMRLTIREKFTSPEPAADAAGHNGKAEENLCSSCDAECDAAKIDHLWVICKQVDDGAGQDVYRYAGCQNDSCTDQADIFCKTFS